MSGPILFPDGSTGAPSVAGVNDPDTGLAWLANNSMYAVSAGTNILSIGGLGLTLVNNSALRLSGTSADSGWDTSLTRVSAKAIALGPTSGVRLNWATADTLAVQNFAGTAGAHVSTLRTQTTTVAVAALPTCNAGLSGSRASVNDANATTFLSTVAAGGANVVPVFCDGTNWKIG